MFCYDNFIWNGQWKLTQLKCHNASYNGKVCHIWKVSRIRDSIRPFIRDPDLNITRLNNVRFYVWRKLCWKPALIFYVQQSFWQMELNNLVSTSGMMFMRFTLPLLLSHNVISSTMEISYRAKILAINFRFGAVLLFRLYLPSFIFFCATNLFGI